MVASTAIAWPAIISMLAGDNATDSTGSANHSATVTTHDANVVGHSHQRAIVVTVEVCLRRLPVRGYAR
jgi:hypothetical protein